MRKNNDFEDKRRVLVLQEINSTDVHKISVSKASYKNAYEPKENSQNIDLRKGDCQHYIIGDVDRIDLHIDQALSDLVAEEQERQTSKCDDRFRPTIWIRIKECLMALVSSIDNIPDKIVFYAERRDKRSCDNIEVFRKIFERVGCSVYVKHSQPEFYRFIKCQSPVLVHSASAVPINPVVNSKVKVGVFDFDDSCGIANSALCFCKLSLGWLASCHSFKVSQVFYRRYYEELVKGLRPVSAYKKISEDVPMTPRLHPHSELALQYDRCLFPRFEKCKEKYR